jgi:hypothetical protein
VHQHLRHVRPVWLVLRQIENELDGAADALRIVGREQRPLALRNAVRDALPERDGLVACHRLHEADGRTTIHAIHEHVGKTLDGWGVEGVNAADRPRHRHCRLRVRSAAKVASCSSTIAVGLRSPRSMSEIIDRVQPRCERLSRALDMRRQMRTAPCCRSSSPRIER